MLSKNQLDAISKELYKSKALTFEQKDHMSMIQETFEDYGGKLNSQLAYVLATVFHEVGSPFLPVREGYAKSDEEAIKIVTRMFEQGKIKTNYAKPASNGKSYFGRGFVQLTWEANYKTMGKKLSLPLWENPSLALENYAAAQIVSKGMIDGLFTGKKLSDYITESKTDYVGARRIINGTDRASMIAEYADKFKKALDIK